MNLINRDPAQYVGRTIIFRHQFWLLDEVNESLQLSKPGLGHKGKLTRAQFNTCRLYMSADEIRKHYPKIIRLLRAVCNLTEGEAVSAVQGYFTTGPSFNGSEALARIGGSYAAITRALRFRNVVRMEYSRHAATHSSAMQ